ncbi:hybrid sensor histidine kinase/response regulator [Phormidium sp. CCY1219]|uniref:hybrid sensor histidine kinase/response regulator n=1 Tax=Phormidium sp. CCY1219 TaxID=2886104 RepID=UPI002D771524|nr:ATP-binding protein [Phormidium sp. CCY1219]
MKSVNQPTGDRQRHFTPQSLSDMKQEPVSVLIVDDRPIVGEAVRRLLATETDIQVHYCSDPTRAVEMATEIQPTVILQDLVMPEIDGLMLLRFFRANPATRHIPIIVLSTQENPTQKAEAFANGANDYLVKLPHQIEFIARVRYHSTAYLNFRQRHEAELIRQYNQELERRVAQRTRQLEEVLDHLKQTQAKLVHREKMSGLGQMVAGIAHEINNPISFIAGNVAHSTEYTRDLLDLIQLYQETYPNPTPEIEALHEEIDVEFIRQDLPKIMSSMQAGSDRIRQIVENLRSFSRFDESKIKPVNLHEGIESTLQILQHRLHHTNIQLVKDYADLPTVECDAGSLNQVFLNILTNAIDAVESSVDSHSSSVNSHSSSVSDPQSTSNNKGQMTNDKGQMTNNQIQMTNNQGQMTIRIRTEVIDGNVVAIRIADNGCGIAPEHLKRIFNPFFTTKEVGKGTGLGLSISYQIVVDKHKGSLHCESTPGEGTEFTIAIPLRHNNITHLCSSTERSPSPQLREIATA